MKKTSKICVALLLALAMAFALVATVACEQNPCANGHTLNAVAKKDANCKEAGYEAYWQCSVCQKLFSDEAGTREISSPTAIAKNNEHKYEWKSDETQHWQECSVCLTKTDKENHGTADSEGKCPTCRRSLASPQPVEQFVSAPFNGFVTKGSFVTDDFLALTFTDEQESGYAPLMLMVGFGDDVVFLFYKVEENKVTVYQPDSLVSSDTFGDLVGEGTIEGNKLSLSLEVVLLGQAETKQIDFEAEMYKLHLQGAFAEDMPEFMWVAKDSLVAALALGDMGSNDTVKFNDSTYDDEAQLLDLKMPAQESTLEVINNDVEVQSVELDQTQITLKAGESVDLVATVLPDNATDKSVQWESDDPDVATVDNGHVEAVSSGSATITVTTNSGNKQATCTVTVSSSAPQPEQGLASGDYNILLKDETNNLVWYVTGDLNNKGGLTVDHSKAKVAILTVINENGKYTLKIGEEYLEAYLNNGQYKNMRLVDTPSDDAVEWKWSEEYNTFCAEFSDETRYLGGNYYNKQVDDLYDNAVTLSTAYYFTDNPVVIHFEIAVPTSHQHTVTYEHVANTWTHKVKCTDPSCPDSYEEIVKCTPEFNVCADCDHEYSTQDILDALFALVSTTSEEELSGTYRLTGVIKETGDVTYYENGASYETTLTITVDDMDIVCFNMYGDSQEQLESLKVGDKITVSGRLVNYKGTKEFDSSCVLEEVVGGTVDPDPDVGYGTEENPLSVSQALALAQKECADDDSVTQQEVVAKGKVQSTPKDNGTYLGQFYLVDESDPNAKILVYTISKTSGVADPVQNDIITIKGYIKNYKGYSDTATLEFANNGDVFVVMVQNERGNSTITIGAHDGATLSAIASTAKNGSEITFTVSPDGGKKIVAVKVNSVEISADGQGNYKFTLLGDSEITVETINEGEQEAQKLYSVHLFDDSEDSINNYTSTGSATKDNFTLNFSRFNNNTRKWSNVRCGHKKDAQTGDKVATITTAQVVAQRITKVVVTVDDITNNTAQYINSFKLVVASDSDFTKDVEEVEVTMKVGINEFVVATPTADRYYKIVIDSDATGKNGCYQFSTVEFWGYAD